MKPNQERAHLGTGQEEGLSQRHFAHSRIPKSFSTVTGWISGNSLAVSTGTGSMLCGWKAVWGHRARKRIQTPTRKEPAEMSPEDSFLSLSFKWLDYLCSQGCSTIKGPQSPSSLFTNHQCLEAGGGGEEARPKPFCRTCFCEEGSWYAGTRSKNPSAGTGE